jgi:hypothetical protein
MMARNYLKTNSGKKAYDKDGFNRWTDSKDKKQTVYGSNYKLGVGTKKFGEKKTHW